MAVFDKEINLIAFIALCLVGSFFFQNVETRSVAAKEEWPKWDETSRLDLARCIRAESDNFERDWPLLGWCLVKQWRAQPYGRSISDQIRAHCAVFDKRSKRYYFERQKKIRASTWTNPLHGSRNDWDDLRNFIERFTAGEIRDPCPVCIWWAGKTDHIYPNWICPVERLDGRGNRFCYARSFPGPVKGTGGRDRQPAAVSKARNNSAAGPVSAL